MVSHRFVALCNDCITVCERIDIKNWVAQMMRQHVCCTRASHNIVIKWFLVKTTLWEAWKMNIGENNPSFSTIWSQSPSVWFWLFTKLTEQEKNRNKIQEVREPFFQIRHSSWSTISQCVQNIAHIAQGRPKRKFYGKFENVFHTNSEAIKYNTLNLNNKQIKTGTINESTEYVICRVMILMKRHSFVFQVF